MRQLYVDSRKAGNNFFNKLNADDEAPFRNFTRMSRKDLEYLLRKISPIVRKSDTNFREAIPPRVWLLVTLRYLATSDSYILHLGFCSRYLNQAFPELFQRCA
nr:unnamed protein product [Callosobruchus chinensis]